jgi:glycosyltransferase involved in cell wall biosynthesis
MKKIGYNAYTLNKPITGVGRYLQALSLLNLGSLSLKKIAFSLNDNYCWEHGFDEIYPSNVNLKFRKLIWNYLHFYNKKEFSIYHSPFPFLPFSNFKNIKKVITVHDVLFLTNPEWYPKLEVLFMRLSLYLSVKMADAIICVSETTKKELIKYYPSSVSKITVVFNPIIESNNIFSFSNLTANPNISPLLLKGKYFVLPSNRHPRKNIFNAIEGFLKSEFYKNDYKLCLCGLNESIDEFILDKNIVELKYLSDDDYNILIRNSSGIFYFSYAEGFGYPIIEAIEANIPIFCSKIPTSTEIIGDFNEYLCIDLSASGITNYLNSFFYQPSKIKRLLLHIQSLKKEFDYHKFESSMLNIYQSLIN